MVDEGDAEIKKLRAELERVRRDTDERIEDLKKQQTESKAKAKIIIQRQREEQGKKIKSLEEDARLRANEMTQVKQLLRHAEDEKSALENQASVLKEENRTLDQRLTVLQTQLDTSEKERSESDPLLSGIKSERDQLASQVTDLQTELQQKQDEQPTPQNNDDSDSERKTVNSEDMSTELFQMRQRLELLVKQLEKANADLDARNRDQGSIITDLRQSKSNLEEKLSKAESRMSELETQVESTEEQLVKLKQEVSEKENAIASATTNNSSDEEKKILEAKIEEMDRLVASKQAEIGRVREKARTYLKELNAEKRTMAEKNKNEVDELEKHLDSEREKASSMEQKADNAAKEVDNCLAVIREKQKSMQMLRMNITTHKKSADEAKQETESLRTEFARYKERARLALQEKENAGGVTEADVDAATASVRAELERSHKEIHELRRRVEQLRRIEMEVDEARERAQRAETVADLLRKDATGGMLSMVGTGSMANTNYSQVDRLEEKISKLENELSSACSETEDVRSQHATTTMRLEGTERALHAAELKARNQDTASKSAIETLKARVEELEVARKKAQEAAAAAQRTAAAAAKALTFSGSMDDEDNEQGRSGQTAPSNVQGLHENGAYDMEFEPNGSRSSFAIALEDHSEKLGLSPRRAAGSQTALRNGPVGSNDVVGVTDDGTIAAASWNKEKASNTSASAAQSQAEVQAREQHIAVLITQLAELGALFDEVQRESELRGEQMELLKAEVKNLDAKLASAEKLKNGAPFSYLRTIVVRYLETDDPTLLPVICNVLSFSDDETSRVKSLRGKAKAASANSTSSYFSIPFLGSR